MKTAEVFIRSLEIRNLLRDTEENSDKRIDGKLLPVLPYRISNRISLVIIGQDPTVKNSESRNNIEYSLNLDKNGSLKSYIMRICSGTGIPFEEIYATNIFKYFYTEPPAQTIHILKAHLPSNLELLQEELAAFPKAKVITLGNPVLKLLTGDEARVRSYWDYQKGNKTNGIFKKCDAKENRLGRNFYPFPHQPSITKEFYTNTVDKYIKFVRDDQTI
jgi:uracil-DNA glycosylase